MFNKKEIIVLGIGFLIVISSIFQSSLINLFPIYLLIAILITNYLTKESKLFYFLSLTILALLSILIHNINLGIEFKGGTRIILQIDEIISTSDMLDLVERIKNRLSALGLEQVVVKGIENKFIYIESGDKNILDKISKVITRKGEFIGIVDGEIVIKGDYIIPNTVQIILDRAQIGGADWGVQFAIEPSANIEFIEKVRGKANKPLYMFLDPPRNGYIILNKSRLLNPQEALKIVSYLNITIIWDDDIYYPNDSFVITDNEELELENKILVKTEDLYPEYLDSRSLNVFSWKALNLISAPILSPSITSGNNIGMRYLITGIAKNRPALEEAKEIASLLRGGGIPYNIEIIGTTNIPAIFGETSLYYSILGIIISVLAVGLFASIRYKNIKIASIMMLITILEMIILLAIIGRFTLDLSAIVGLIAAAGVSIDAQIIITDFRLRRKEKFDWVYRIIKNNFIIATLVITPLVILGNVEVVGFAIIAIVSYILGYYLSRSVYNELLEKFVLNAGGGI